MWSRHRKDLKRIALPSVQDCRYEIDNLDVVDQCGELIEKSKDILKDKNVRHFMVKGLQELEFNEKYDCIWVQWVFSHLND